MISPRAAVQGPVEPGGNIPAAIIYELDVQFRLFSLHAPDLLASVICRHAVCDDNFQGI